jgi:N-methylhydantoinase B/oxoprolinase/acetone carboxylase alpha subunit
VQSQDVGGQVPGRCSLPDGNVYQEGSVIELTY